MIGNGHAAVEESASADISSETRRFHLDDIDRSPVVMLLRSMTVLMLGGCLLVRSSTCLSSSEFPEIPLLGDNWLVGMAIVCVVVGLPSYYLGWLILHFGPPLHLVVWLRWPFLIGGLLALAGLFIGDQHWLQPWAWQAFLLLLIDVSCAEVDDKRRWWMRLACSVYLFSAISKLDVAFIDNLGRVIVSKGFAPAVGLDAAFWSPELKRLMAATMPVVELSAGVMLWTVRWRKLGLVLATAMHCGLLLALGPLGLDHHAGVLIWNVFFVLHVWILFRKSSLRLWKRPQRDEQRQQDTARRFRDPMLCVVLLLPVGEPFGLFDHWPGWSVYSNRPPIVRLEVAFPEPVVDLDWIGAPQSLTNLQVISLSGWSYATWRTPAYPQERFQLAVIAALLEKLPDNTRFRVRMKSFDPWRSGRAEESTIETKDEIEERLDDFWLPADSTEWQLPEEIRRTLPKESD